MFLLYSTNLTDNAKNAFNQTFPIFVNTPSSKAYVVNPFSLTESPENIQALKTRYPIISEYLDNDNSQTLSKKELNNIVSNEKMRVYKEEILEEFSWAEDRIHIRSKYGESPVVLGTYVLSYKPDLVVLSVEEDDIEDEIKESILFYFMNNTNYPILLVPAGASFDELKDWTLLFNHETDTDSSILGTINDHTPIDLEVLNIKDSALDLPQNSGAIPNCKMMYSTSTIDETESGASSQKLLAYLETKKVDALAVPSRRSKFFEKLFTNEVAKKVFLEKKIPVLCLPQDISHGLF